MIKKRYSTTINAPREKVWQALWDLDSYSQWTSAFCEGSYANTDNWKEGTRVQFLTPAGEGMYSEVARNIPNEFMSFRHLGEIKDGMERPNDEKSSAWSGAMEDYTLRSIDGTTTDLTIELDISEEYREFFDTAFPKAMAKVKELAEE